MTCDRNELVHAYHDDELSSADRSVVEAHLAECADCRELLADLQHVSQMLNNVDFPEMSRSATSRMQGAWWASQATQEQGIRRLTAWLTGAAAAVLVFVPLYTQRTAALSDMASTRSWEMMALVPPAGPREDPNADLVQVAQWFANDLAVEQNQ